MRLTSSDDEGHERQGDDDADQRDDDVEGALGEPARRAVVGVQDAHEPRRRQLLDRQPAERELVDLGQPDDLEARVGGAEQLAEHLGPAALHGDHHEVG